MSEAIDDDRWTFGPWVLRLPCGPLLRDGAHQPLSNRAIDVLALLVQRHGGIVTKQALLDHAWPGHAVEEGNLYVHISELRKLFGHQAIRSIYGRGYQWVLAAGESPTAHAGCGDELAALRRLREEALPLAHRSGPPGAAAAVLRALGELGVAPAQGGCKQA